MSSLSSVLNIVNGEVIVDVNDEFKGGVGLSELRFKAVETPNA